MALYDKLLITELYDTFGTLRTHLSSIVNVVPTQSIIKYICIYVEKAQICSKKNIKMQTNFSLKEILWILFRHKTKFRGPQAPNL